MYRRSILMDAAGDEHRHKAKACCADELRHRQDATKHHNPPHTAPMSGNAHSAYRMFFWLHSNCGVGIAENIANATAIVCKIVIPFPLLCNKPGYRILRGRRDPRGQRCRFGSAPAL